jgi:23S rRNA-/tRNA-specific pseudouridylate synthase
MALPRLRWIVSEQDAAPLSALLDRLGESAALAAGLVFVDGKRRSEPEFLLERGAAVEIYAPAAPRAEGAIEILHRAGELLWVNKPAGIPTEPDHRGTLHSLVARVAEMVGVPRVELHALSRLDSGVSGVVLLSESSEASARVDALRARGALRRRYVAIGRSDLRLGTGVWRDGIGRGGKGPRRIAGGREARSAETRFSEVGRAGESAVLLALEPVTGRTHQLRVHAAAHGAPLYGDRLYGGPTRVTDSGGRVRELGRIFLHAGSVRMSPGEPADLRVTADVAPEMVGLWRELGGSAADFEPALADSLFVE